MIDFKALIRGIPNHVVTRLMSATTPGVDFVGCTKAMMLETWNSDHAWTSSRTNREKFAKLVAEWRKEQADKLERERAAALPVKPGDEVVVFNNDQPFDIAKIVRVTADRIYTTAGPDVPYALDGRLVRRKHASDAYERIEPATEEHRRALRRHSLIYKLVHAPWHRLSEQQMQQVLDMVEKTERKE